MSCIGKFGSQGLASGQSLPRVGTHFTEMNIHMTQARMVRMLGETLFQDGPYLGHVSAERFTGGVSVETPGIEDHETFGKDVGHFGIVREAREYPPHEVGKGTAHGFFGEVRVYSRVQGERLDGQYNLRLHLRDVGRLGGCRVGSGGGGGRRPLAAINLAQGFDLLRSESCVPRRHLLAGEDAGHVLPHRPRRLALALLLHIVLQVLGVVGGVVVGVALEVVVGPVAERHHGVGQRAVRRHAQTGQEAPRRLLVLVRKHVAQAQVEVGAPFVEARHGAFFGVDVAHGRTAVRTQVHRHGPFQQRKHFQFHLTLSLSYTEQPTSTHAL
mmetsp:Transcript_32977/g.49152  ORF Transcript_32977/g.49152 Transcript_32977/m.49152 type:complete len:327 (-) Transcript_32977:139-1119(-)